ncbi:LacI family DNA-binding transcriptional regulator [Tengunoibacter tsumagoiensis]|uniref:LacI family transcriptional regulator n=1 Tax=Tengunoibacter tsumagoiensis TaxID=2014871 RepID=A0A401ZUZ6_9CHLR|nr:substrate-binding domain-containing protein [Tengunoibacter tsumagoiensis]GCE10768.1 LacI family transcriptional regulator [Tengunoibacter tsumagoiensis]
MPSINAQGLNGRSQLLGILMPRYLWPALQEITWAIADYITNETRYEIIFYSCSNDNGDGYTRVLDQIVSTNLVAGLIATLYDQSPEHLVELYEQGLPVVLLDTIGLQTNLPTVCADHYSGAYEGVRYLLESGHRRIGYIQGTAHWKCSHDRYRAYCDALASYGLQPDPELFQQAEYTPKSGEVAARALLTLEDRPTAIFATNDDMASSAIMVAQELHLHVPEDISILGFNDDPVPFVRSMLTTVHQPFSTMARCAAELLVSQIQTQYRFSDELQRILQMTTRPTFARELGELPMPFSLQFPTHLVTRTTSARRTAT